MKKGKKVLFIIILVAIFGIFLVLPSLNTKQSVYPDDLKLSREQFPLIYDFELEPGINQINLNEGVNLENVYKIEIISKGCWNDIGKNTNSETIDFNDKNINYGFTSCEFLTYPDGGGESAYIHYETRNIEVSKSLSVRNLNINVQTNQDLQLIQRTLKIYELVDCSRDSQCPLIRVGTESQQPICDVNYHQCSLQPKTVSNPGTKPDKITEGKSTTNPLIYIVITLVITIIVGFALYLIFFRKKR